MTVNQVFLGFKLLYTFLSRTGVIPSCLNTVYTSHTALVNTGSGFDPINSSDLFNIGDTLRFIIDGSYVFVERIDIDINFETMVPYFKTRLKNIFERTVTKGKNHSRMMKVYFSCPSQRLKSEITLKI